ncbi:hypothetical protein AcW1_001317 [Taiwanofungus camphoratus]|nr:hypothetical protein AcW1_001317 [Antrodia cinnamomea]
MASSRFAEQTPEQFAETAKQITECLASTLSPNTNTRIAAELKLHDILLFPESGLVLAQLVLAQDADLALRQSAAIALRKYVRGTWSILFFSSKKGAPPPPPEVKAVIRQTIFQGLSDSHSKIRSLCAQILSVVASSDWPDEWPDLLHSLVGLLSSNSPESVHGAMQVMSELIKADFVGDQTLPVLQELLPALLAILVDEKHSLLTRARTIEVFKQCLETLFMVKGQHPEASKVATKGILPAWLEAFRALLNTDPRRDVEGENWDGLAIRIEAFKALEFIHMGFSHPLIPYLSDFLTASVHHLDALYPTFATYYLSGGPTPPTSSEGQPVSLPQLACPILAFVGAVLRIGRVPEWFDQSKMGSLLTSVFSWMQMTVEDEEEWANDANAFVAQESDESLQYSTRQAGFEMLSSLLERSPAAITKTFQTVIQHIATEADGERNNGKQGWWRPLEAALAAVGSQARTVLECIDDEGAAGRPKPIDIESLLANVIPSLLGLSECPFLQGRAFVFASQYAKLLPAQLAGQYLNAAIQVIEAPTAGIPIKISAVKALYNFCKNVDDVVLIPMAPRMVKDIGPFLSETSEDTLTLVLETLSVVMELDNGAWITVELAHSLVQAVLNVWMKYNKDPIFISILTDILETLAGSSSHGVYETVVKEALPALCNVIMASTAQEIWITGAAIDLVSSLVRGAPVGGLGDGFFSALAPSLFICMKTVEDREVIQNGIVCLTLIIRKDCGQLLSWTDPISGQSGLESLLAVIAKQLQNEAEAGGLVIGDLIIHLLRRVGDSILPVLPDLLQAMIRRMVVAQTATFIQSLVIPFAFLIHNQRDVVLSLLESTLVDNRSALDILIQTWCENAETFQGFWAIRVSHLALCSLYASERPSLQNLMVKGDLIVKEETKNVIMTRSRTKQIPTEFTSVPFPVKALKLLLHDLQFNEEAAPFTLDKVLNRMADLQDDDDDEEWTDDEKLYEAVTVDDSALLSDILDSNPRGMPFDNDNIFEAGDDEDLQRDPISQINMHDHLLSFLHECAARNTNHFSSNVDQLTRDEILVVRKVVSEQ